jgi:hypothetical protein
MTIGRRLALAGGLAVATAAGLLVATLFGDSPGVLERAQAALDPNGRILHVVSRQVDDRMTLSESWSTSDGSRFHVASQYASQSFGADCVIGDTFEFLPDTPREQQGARAACPAGRESRRSSPRRVPARREVIPDASRLESRLKRHSGSLAHGWVLSRAPA